MANINVPKGYQRIMPYLILTDAEKFLPFMQQVFGATEKMKMMRDETTIMHAELIVNDQVIMYAGANEQYPAEPGGFFIYVEDADKTYQAALAAGASSIMPPDTKDYGRSGGIKDPCGNSWWITSV
jgi:PhnB protein